MFSYEWFRLIIWSSPTMPQWYNWTLRRSNPVRICVQSVSFLFKVLIVKGTPWFRGCKATCARNSSLWETVVDGITEFCLGFWLGWCQECRPVLKLRNRYHPEKFLRIGQVLKLNVLLIPANCFYNIWKDIVSKGVREISHSYFCIHEPWLVSSVNLHKQTRVTHHPINGAAVYWTPPMSKPSLLKAGNLHQFNSILLKAST